MLSRLSAGRRSPRRRRATFRTATNGFPDFLPTDAYNLVNLYVGYQPTPDVLASFGIDNLFNRYYVQYMNVEGQSAPGQAPAFIFPSPGITFKGGLKIRFGA